MRWLLCSCVAALAWAGEPALPGLDPAFVAQVRADTQGGARPWKAFRAPEVQGSAVVEVLGELTREELRQVAFQEFLAWFRADLRRFLADMGGLPSADAGAAALASERHAGRPVPRPVTFGRLGS